MIGVIERERDRDMHLPRHIGTAVLRMEQRRG